jgi:hypothetical protein
MTTNSFYTILRGPLVDGYLSTEGAIAQAADRDTILLHSSLFKMGVSDGLLILAHEFAHLRQLATPGNDPTRALEEEAWEAALAWMAGRAYRIRGKARRPLNALAIIQGGKRGHPSAPPWYRSNPVEPIGHRSQIMVKSVTVLKDMTLESIMDVIIREKQKQIVIVCHGWSEGLAIPLTDTGIIAGGAQRQQIFPLSADRSFDDGGMKSPVISVQDVAAQAHISEQQVTKLRAKMNQIRDVKLEHIAFRACDMGQSTDTLQAFRNFFGAKSVSAPKLEDSYGQFSPLLGAGVEAWTKTKRKERFHVWIDRNVAFGIRDAGTLSYQIVCKAPDNKTFVAWVKAHISDQVGLDRHVVYHGMVRQLQQIAGLNAPIVYFVRDNSFISNIVYYDGSNP